MTAFQLLCHFEPAHTSHHNIQQDKTVDLNVHCKCFLCRESHINLVTFGLEIETQNLAEILLVVNYQYVMPVVMHNAKIALCQNNTKAETRFLGICNINVMQCLIVI